MESSSTAPRKTPGKHESRVTTLLYVVFFIDTDIVISLYSFQEERKNEEIVEEIVSD
jgi:hypothetical protein